jgi:methylphosphotriester-DNA--protein-cysteine methyltransferase
MPSVNAAHAWETVLSRDCRGDGRFVYAVSSTRVYSRPSCPSRRPTRNRVIFFDSPRLSEVTGYRACLAVGHSRLSAPRQRSELSERAVIWMTMRTSPSRFDSWLFTLVSVRFICNGPSRIGSGSPRRRTKVSKE